MRVQIDIMNYVFLLFYFLFIFSLLLFVRASLLKLIKRIKDRTETRIDDLIFETIRVPSIYWILGISVYLAIYFSDLPQKYLSFFNKIIQVIIIFSITYTVAKFVEQLVKHYFNKFDLPFTPTGIIYAIMKGIIFVIGFLVILSVLNVPIAPFITSLGIGGLAVALALQDTLSNLFAGIHILIEKSVRVGDFVRLENGQEGYVEEIGWRTTKIRMLSNNLVIIPNSKLSQSIITNFHLPEKRLSLLIPISVSYNEDPDRVEEVILDEVRKAASELEGLLTEPPPVLRFNPGFGESSLDFTLVCSIKEFADNAVIQHQLRKRIFKRFKQEGIEIPFPHRVVYLKNENSK